MDTKHLKQRHQTWYVQIAVPRDLQPVLGKKTITKTLKTRDLREANSRKHAAVADIMEHFDITRKSAGEIRTPADLIKFARLDRGGDRFDFQTALEDTMVSMFGIDDDGLPVVPEAWREAFGLAYKVQDGRAGKLLSEVLEEHLESIAPSVRNQTLNARRKRVEAFLEWAGGEIEIGAVTETMARDYVLKVLNKTSLSPKSRRDILSDFKALWNWSDCQVNPWPDQTKLIKETSRGTREKTNSKRRDWTRQEIRSLLAAIKSEAGVESDLWAMTALALYTGMRGNEIAEIQLEEIHQTHIHIPEAKTEGGIRDIPIHPAIRPLINRLKKTSKDGYLISGLKRGGEDNKRGHYILKTFGRFIRRHVTDDPRLVFHSLRKSVSTALENASIPENVAAQLLGHAKDSMTYGLYSGGLDMKVLTRATRSIDYGPVVRKLI